MSISVQNQNPLSASRYADELADSLANLIIQNDPIVKDAAMKTLVQNEIQKAKSASDEAHAKADAGMEGTIISLKNDITGYVLYANDMLYLGPDFAAKPSLNLRVYLSQVVDPRDGVFPDTTAIDLGPLKTDYGAQQYAVPHQDHPELYRSFAIYDTTFKKLFAFSQISK